MSRKTRIMAAWKVLRGEWTAQPPARANHFDIVTAPPTTAMTAYLVNWQVGA